MTTIAEHGDLRHQLTDIANAEQEVMRGMSESEAASYVKFVISTSTIVLGVWRDVASPDGVGILPIKAFVKSKS